MKLCHPLLNSRNKKDGIISSAVKLVWFSLKTSELTPLEELC